MITFDSTAYNPVIIDKDSPIIGKGSSLVSSLVTKDFFGTKRIGSYNIGAVQSVANPSTTPPTIPPTTPTMLQIKQVP